MAQARTSYRAFYERSRKLASALSKAGIRKGDTVAVMLANTPAMLEAHYGVPMIGAVLNTLNTRLDAAAIAFMLDHASAKLLITDREFSATIKEALHLAKSKPLIIDYDDPEFPQSGERLSHVDYEAFIADGDPEFAWSPPADEWDAISLNYTSGTTGNPKGRRLASSRRRLDVLRQYARHPHGPASGVFVDAADVPLQWLGFSLVAISRCRDAYLPAMGARQSDV